MFGTVKCEFERNIKDLIYIRKLPICLPKCQFLFSGCHPLPRHYLRVPPQSKAYFTRASTRMVAQLVRTSTASPARIRITATTTATPHFHSFSFSFAFFFSLLPDSCHNSSVAASGSGTSSLTGSSASALASVVSSALASAASSALASVSSFLASSVSSFLAFLVFFSLGFLGSGLFQSLTKRSATM